VPRSEARGGHQFTSKWPVAWPEVRGMGARAAECVPVRVSDCDVTLVTNWLRYAEVSAKLVCLGGFASRQENHHVGRGT
jgi:hypothetical protein